jgi:hypothetical protein
MSQNNTSQEWESSLFGQKVFEDRRKLSGQTPRLGHRFQLPVNVLGVTLFADAHRAHDYNMMPGINSVNDAMISKLVLPVVRHRRASLM